MDSVRPAPIAGPEHPGHASARRIRRLARTVAWTALSAAGALPAIAQGADAPEQAPPAATAPVEAAAASSGARVFEAAYFGQYNPVTAFDMVSRVPGFELDDGETRRGFGATAGNVLVNGERPSSKTAISDQLKRIPAASVIRLELMSGSSSGSDVRGQSQLVNVVISKAAGASPTTFVLAARHIEFSNRIGWTAQMSRSFSLGDTAELAIDLQLPNLRGRSESLELIYNPDGSLREISEGYGQPNQVGVQGAATLKWRPTARDSLNFNVQYGPTWNSVGIGRIDRSPAGALNDTLFGRSELKNNYNAEVGADWEHRFSDVVSVKALGLATFSNVDQHDHFDIFIPAIPRDIDRTQDRSTEAGERVGRVAMTWRASAAHTLEFGVEGAFNFRDTTLDIQQSVDGGAFTDVLLDVSDARVEEVRGEAFVTDVWNVSPSLTLEAGFTFEASRITQSGSSQNEREFTYPKPRLVGTYRLGNGAEFRASLDRDVSQLDFSEFASTVNFQDSSSQRGNPDLEPEKTWKARLEWERRFGARGALTLALFHDEIEDVKDYIVLGGQDALGNIGDGRRTGVEVRAALPLASLGIPNAELRFTGQYQQSEVTDPWTGETRPISITSERTNSPPGSPILNTGPKDWGYILSYRHELPSFSSAWGATLLQWSGRRDYKHDELLIYDREDPRLDFFLETTALKPVTIRLSVNNILSPEETRERYYYAPDRASGSLTQYDVRTNKGGPDGTFSYGIQVSGRF